MFRFFEKPEIIIGDNDSSDNSLDVVMFFNDRTDIKIINKLHSGKALNIGVKNASRDYVMILSAHSQILKLDFKSIKKKLDTYIAILENKFNIYGKRITQIYMDSF